MRRSRDLSTGTSKFYGPTDHCDTFRILHRSSSQAYQRLLHRAADPGGLAYSVTALQSGTRDETIMAQLAGSDEYEYAILNHFVNNAYADLLGRRVDVGGSAWANGLLRGGQSPAFVAVALLSGTEYRTDLVANLYHATLHRSADPGGQQWALSQLQSGTTSEQLQSTLMGGAEYCATRGGSTNTGFLTAVYADVYNRAVELGGASYWLGQLNAGVSRQSVAYSQLMSAEGLGVKVNGMYQRLLHRAADPGGLAYSVTALQSGTHDETIMAQLAGSDEYLQR